MSYLTIQASAVADLAIDQAWEKMRDLEKAHMYVPDLTNTEITTEQREGVGTSRRVYSHRPTLIETVTHWDQGHGFKLRIQHDNGEGVPPLFASGTFEYRLDPVSDTQTRLTNTMEMKMKWGLLGGLLAKLLRAPMQKMHQQIVVGQKLYYETGEKPAKSAVIEEIKRG